MTLSHRVSTFAASLVVAVFIAGSHAAVISVTETGNLEPERSIVENGGAGVFDPGHPGTNVADGSLFGEDVDVFTDRTHEHNGAAFDGGGALSTSGGNIVPLPAYLVGNEYVTFANDGRDNNPYNFNIKTDVNSDFYLLLDNRLNGTAGNTSSPNTTDPDLGGNLTWVTADGWQRVNTGISPGGQADYTGVDEGGNAVGPGLGLNQFYSVYKLTGTDVDIKVQGIGGSNNYSVVIAEAGPTPPPPPFTGAQIDVGPNGQRVAADFIGVGDQNANTNGVDMSLQTITVDGQVLTMGMTSGGAGNLDWRDRGDGTGSDSLVPVGEDFVKNNAGHVSVLLGNLPAGTYTATSYHVDPNFTQSNDISVFVTDAAGQNVLQGSTGDAGQAIGGVNGLTNTNIGNSAATFTVVSNGRDPVIVRFDGTPSADNETPFNGLTLQLDAPGSDFFRGGLVDYAIIDFGAGNHRLDVGANRVNSAASTSVTAFNGEQFMVSVDNGGNSGSIDLRDRGNSTNGGEFLVPLAEDHFKNNAGFVNVTLDGLPAGEYEVTSIHVDAEFSQSEAIDIFVTDAIGANVLQGVQGDASFPGGNPGGSGENLLNTALILDHSAIFTVVSDGINPVSILFDGSGANDTEVPVSGLVLRRLEAGVPEPATATLSLLGLAGLAMRRRRRA